MSADPHDAQVEDLSAIVRELVQLRTQVLDLETQKQKAQAEVNRCQTDLLSVKKHMRELKALLDHCLDTGEDVTTVKLTKTQAELVDAKQKQVLLEEFTKPVYTDYDFTHMRNTILKKTKF